MVRKKTLKWVVTFPTTTEAMKMEAICGTEKGRLIPVPKEISAGCGLAWCAEPALADEMTLLMEKHRIPCEDKRMIELYA